MFSVEIYNGNYHQWSYCKQEQFLCFFLRLCFSFRCFVPILCLLFMNKNSKLSLCENGYVSIFIYDLVSHTCTTNIFFYFFFDWTHQEREVSNSFTSVYLCALYPWIVLCYSNVHESKTEIEEMRNMSHTYYTLTLNRGTRMKI